MSGLDYDIAVFAVNEAERIERCVRAIDRAAVARRARVVVLLNGTTDNSAELLRSIRLSNVALSVYLFAVADKSNAINRFFYDLRLDAATYFCIDGYTKIGPDALRVMAAALDANPHALAAAAVPVNGRWAKVAREPILKGGALTGQLCALRPDFINRFTAGGFHLPLRLYWGDGLLGSMAAHNLDAMGTEWDDRRIVGIAEATFEIPLFSVFRWRDIRRQYRREVRQARGRLENAAIKTIIYSGGYAALPDDANAMVKNWLVGHDPEPGTLRERYFRHLALGELDEARPAPSALEPQLLLEAGIPGGTHH